MGSKNNQKIINDYLKGNYVISENKSELYSILIPIIFSKKIFKRGSEIQTFLKEEIGIEYANYVFKSRALIASKIVKSINDMSVEESVSLNRLIIDKIAEMIEIKYSIDEDDVDSNKNKSLFVLWNEHIEEIK